MTGIATTARDTGATRVALKEEKFRRAIIDRTVGRSIAPAGHSDWIPKTDTDSDHGPEDSHHVDTDERWRIQSLLPEETRKLSIPPVRATSDSSNTISIQRTMATGLCTAGRTVPARRAASVAPSQQPCQMRDNTCDGACKIQADIGELG